MKVIINDSEYEAVEGETIIQLSDRIGVHIPRFCYHKHLSVVASCRMCLVDIEGIKHAQPACSTPLKEGMKIHTNSNKTKDAQKSSMEFLLINHPLDCPICDQGGECELQDVSLEHGDSHSSYMQLKRVIIDRDISPLISTDMTRCIHCSRCVRFGEEISNVKELGLLNRGEDMTIDSFIEKGVSSELSGNMIDLCPVGALNNKPYRYSARTWDLKEHSAISPHDCLGSNIYYHTYNNRIVRAVPKENQDINKTWLSDRDRFGYEGIYSNDRALKAMIRVNGKLVEYEKQVFLQELSKTITKNIEDYGSDMIGCLISGQSTNEELFLFQKLFRSLLISNIDHRTNECDFDYQYDYPLMPSLNCDFNDIGSFDNIILLGVNIKSEFPILSIRLHEASKNKTKIHSINFKSTRTSLRPMMENFKLTSQTNIEDIDILNIEDILKKQNINKQKKNIIIVGPRISYLPNQSNILSMLKKLGETYAVKIGFLTDFCNSTSGWLLGNVPHRMPAGGTCEKNGLNSIEMIKNKLKSYILFNLEPEHDFIDSKLLEQSLENSQCNIVFTSYISPMIEKYADVIIPLTVFAETSGSYINIEGRCQYFDKVINPASTIFSGSSILKQLYNNLTDSNITLNDVKNEVIDVISNVDFNSYPSSKTQKTPTHKGKDSYIPIQRYSYFSDATVRRSISLSETEHSKKIEKTNVKLESLNTVLEK